MIDTHCHLNFKAFKKTLPEVIDRACESGIHTIVIPGTDVKTSRKAVEIAQNHDSIYAAVGIHPHHVYKLLDNDQRSLDEELKEIESLLDSDSVVAVGEVGMDQHVYEDTVYGKYAVDERFISLQKEMLIRQIHFAVDRKLSLILHNRESIGEMLDILTSEWKPIMSGRTVFHCCEPEDKILEFAKQKEIYIGVDGDITYYPEKQEFIKKVPLEMLVLETDSPFLLPEPLKTEKKYPNEPKNIALFMQLIADLKKISIEKLDEVTTENATKLFQLK